MTGSEQHDLPINPDYSLRKVRARNPFVHCIVNEAAATITANVLLAAGAQPSLTYNPDEINYFVDKADVICINLGMFSAYKLRAAQQAVLSASVKKIPWVLDPTMIDRSEKRLQYCLSLIDMHPPTVIRGNYTEIDTLYQQLPGAKDEWNSQFDNVFVITGETDLVISSGQTTEIETGHPWMSETTGMGCALSALIAAFIAVHQNVVEATIEILKIYGKIGQMAGKHSGGPGTFPSSFIDLLHNESKR